MAYLPKNYENVVLVDQNTPPLIVPFNQTTNFTTLTVDSNLDDRTVTIADTTGFVAGGFITITSIPDNRFYIGRQLGAPAGNVITLDTPLDFEFPAGATAAVGSIDLNVNGSVTPQIFSIRASDPGVPVVVEVTRLLFQCTCATAVDLSKFGDLPALANGFIIRRTDGTYFNIANVKTNGEMAGLMYDFQILTATNPAQGVDGFLGRLTFAGQNKMGVALRLEPGDDLEVIVQDDLSGLTSFFIVAEGHVMG